MKPINFDELMSEVQTSVMTKNALIEKENNSIKEKKNDVMMNPVCPMCQPIINITINPVINTTSQVVEKTKNSPLKELGSVLSFIPNILGK